MYVVGKIILEIIHQLVEFIMALVKEKIRDLPIHQLRELRMDLIKSKKYLNKKNASPLIVLKL